jgi:HAD superfamily hydrolase (TIGR01549 family)
MPITPQALATPKALLLDFGGVIADTGGPDNWAATVVPTVHNLLLSRRVSRPDPIVIEADLVAGALAYAAWGDAMCRPYAPAEVSHEEFWSDYVAADWPASAREAVLAHAETLCHRMGEVRHAFAVRPGIVGLLAEATARGIQVAVVSNSLYGRVHRDFVERAGLADRFAVQLYSDEAGVRKPNPELVLRAARALGVGPEQCWYVGDTWSRDVRVGRRARVGTTILMRSPRTEPVPPPGLDVDHDVADGHQLRALLDAAGAGAHGAPA